MNVDAVTFQQEAMRYERLMYRISYAMLRHNEDCADAVQEALLRAWRSREGLRDMAAFRPWLCRILVNTCNDILRKRPARPFAELTADIPAARPAHDPMMLREAIDALSPEQRTAVILHYLEGWPVKDIAEATGTPQGTVKTRLMYARRHLSQLLADEVEVSL